MNKLLNERAKVIQDIPCRCKKKKPGRSKPHPLENILQENNKELSSTFHDGIELQHNPATTHRFDEPL